jgi:superfamily II DNA or RNA helicase
MKLTINNSISQIEGFTPDQFRMIRRILSYERSEQEKFYMGHHRGLIPLIDRKGYFPTGLTDLLKAYLHLEHIEYTVQDLRKRPPRSKHVRNISLPFAPHQFQIDAAAAAAVTHDRGCVVAPTGSGKSVIIALLIHTFNVKTLIVVPTLYLKQQLTVSLTQYFGSMLNITVENIDSKALKAPGDYDMVIIDEAHHTAAKTYRDLNKKFWNGIYYRFFLTATPVRNRENEQILLESVTGEVIYELSYEEAIAAGTIVPLCAYYVDAPKVEITEHYWKGVYNQLVVDNPDRNKRIMDLLWLRHMQRIPTLCLVKEIRHGDLLTMDGAFLFANGKNDLTREYISRFNEKNAYILIGTQQILGEGVDTVPAEVVIIAGMGKSIPQFQQAVGRVLRVSPGKTHGTVILIRDGSHKYGIAHFNAQKKILLSEYGVKVEKL